MQQQLPPINADVGPCLLMALLSDAWRTPVYCAARHIGRTCHLIATYLSDETDALFLLNSARNPDGCYQPKSIGAREKTQKK